MDRPLMPAQIALEAEMRDMTRARYFNAHAKAEKRGDLADTHFGLPVKPHVSQWFSSGLNALNAVLTDRDRTSRCTQRLTMVFPNDFKAMNYTPPMNDKSPKTLTP